MCDHWTIIFLNYDKLYCATMRRINYSLVFLPEKWVEWQKIMIE